MKISEIKKYPSVCGCEAGSGDKRGSRWGESMFRSYQILTKVKELLAADVKHSMILELIEDMEVGE